MSAAARPAPDPLPGLFRLHDQLRPRRKLWVLPSSPITDWYGHRLADSGTTHVLACRDCGALVWVFRGLKGRLYIADVSDDEARMFRELEYTVDQVLTYLGATT